MPIGSLMEAHVAGSAGALERLFRRSRRAAASYRAASPADATSAGEWPGGVDDRGERYTVPPEGLPGRVPRRIAFESSRSKAPANSRACLAPKPLGPPVTTPPSRSS